MQKLTQPHIDAALKKLKDWSQVGESIQRTFQFANFLTSMKFVDAVAALAEADQHHPDILIRYNRVTLTLSTHDAHAITDKDMQAATKYDEVAKGLLPPPPAPASRRKEKTQA